MSRLVRTVFRRPPPKPPTLADSYQMEPMTSRDANSNASSSNNYDYEFYEPKEDVLKSALPWVLAAGILTLMLHAILIGLIFGSGLDSEATPTTYPPLTTTYKTLATVGQACSIWSDCIPSAFCSPTTLTCTCASQFYYDSGTNLCTSRKTYGQACSASSECEYFVYLDCINNVCDCESSTFYWNTQTQRCEDRRGYTQWCSGISESECFSSALACVNYNGGEDTRCVCPGNQTTYYYDYSTDSCVPRLGHGSTCHSSATANAHFECVDNAWCTYFPNDLTTLRCSCYPSYYWDAASYSCRAKLDYQDVCAYDYHCKDFQLDLRCIAGRCACPTTMFWNFTRCELRKTYGVVCNKTGDCAANSNLYCLYRPEQGDYACLCRSTQYYSLVTNMCTNYQLYQQSCTNNNECMVNMTCETYPAGSSSKACLCAPNFYYYDASSGLCLPLQNYTAYCSVGNECNNLLGFYCDTTLRQCTCASNYYFNGTGCVIRKGQDNYIYGQMCQYSYECKTTLSVNSPRCFQGACV